MYRVEISKPALRALRRAPARLAHRIRTKLDEVARDPRASHRNVKPLKGRDGFRLRVGDWRAIFELDHVRRRLSVLYVGPRGSIYDR